MPDRPTNLPLDQADALEGLLRAFASEALERAEQRLTEVEQRPQIARVQLRMPIQQVQA